MQQRRVRLGDVLDDYCPRERRITNHAVVAMIDDDVKQTRCTTCDTEHEYKHAKVPAPRRKKPPTAAVSAPVERVEVPTLVGADAMTEPPSAPIPDTIAAAPEPEAPEPEAPEIPETDDEWPVHRPLIRATLPRPEGQAPERKPPDFTFRQTGGRFDAQRNGNRPRGNRHPRQAQGQSSGQSRFGSQRSGSGRGPRHGGGQHAGNPHRHGNRQGPPAGQRRPGGHKGPGRGPKRGR